MMTLKKLKLHVIKSLAVFIVFSAISMNAAFSQDAKQSYQNAIDAYTNNEIDNALSYLNIATSKLGKSNAVIENLKVKCYFELKDFDKAEKSLVSFYKYKAASHLVDEMKTYAAQIRKAKTSALKDEMLLARDKDNALYKEAEQTFFLDEIASIEEETSNKKKALVSVETKLKYVPLAEQLKGEIEKDLSIISKLENGKVYLLEMGSTLTRFTSEKKYIVLYGDKYIIFTIPDVAVLKALNKNTISFDSYNAATLARKDYSLGWINSEKIKTLNGKKEMSFLYIDNDKGLFIGGNGDDLIERTFYINYVDNYSFYYFFLGENLWVSVEDYLFNSKTYESTYTEFTNPIIETGTYKQTLDYNLLFDEGLLDMAKDNNVVNTTLSNLNKPIGVSAYLKPNGFRNVFFVKKDIAYQPASKCCQNLKLTEGDETLKRDGYQYFTPASQKGFYSFLQVNNYYETKKTINLARYFRESDEAFYISESKFNSIYESFSKNHGNGAFRNFTSESYTLPYDVMVAMAKVTPTKPLSSAVENRNNEFGTFNDFKQRLSFDVGDEYREIWETASGYNNIAWRIYENSDNKEDLALAIQLVEKALSMNRYYFILDTYAHLLYKTDKFEKALNIIEEAINIGEANEFNVSASVQLRQEISEYQSVMKDSSIELLEKFLVDFPNSVYIDSVRDRLIPLLKERLKNEANTTSLIEETQAYYPGGSSAYRDFLVSNFVYPKAAIAKNIQGKVYIEFFINADGTIVDPKVLRGIGEGCDEAALELVKKMPAWIPGTQEGKPVKTKQVLPISFVLN
jgi:TonB family protein